MGFNPHPALLPGDAHNGWQLYRGSYVSIHTRRCCRVMLYMSAFDPTADTFQSTPGVAAG